MKQSGFAILIVYLMPLLAQAETLPNDITIPDIAPLTCSCARIAYLDDKLDLLYWNLAVYKDRMSLRQISRLILQILEQRVKEHNTCLQPKRIKK